MTYVKLMAAAQAKKLATFLGCCTLIISATIGPVSTGTLLAASTVSSITLSPWDSSIQAGRTRQFIATAKDASGNPVPEAILTWTSSNPAVATVSSGGLATGVSGGSTIIGATIGSVSVGTWMTVTSSTVSSISLSPGDSSIQAGHTQQFTALAKDFFGNPVPGATFTWTSSNQSIATVSNSGLVTGLLAGSTVIGATIGSVSTGTWMTVTSSMVSSITLTPPASSIQTGQNQQFIATAKDAGGNPIPGVTFTWTSSNPAVATVNSSGLATGASGGSTIISATIGPVSSGTMLTVNSSTVSSITLSPWDSSIQAGRTQQFIATAKDAGGNPVPGVTLTWTSSNPAVATVSSGGLATGVSSGSAIIGATIGSVSVGTWMTVTSSTVNSITLTPPASSIQASQNQQFIATAKDAGGNSVPGVTFTWTSSNPAVATVSSGGLATGVSGGSTVISATIGSVSTGMPLTVTASSSPLKSITVTPPAPSIQASQSQQFVAVAKDMNGNVMPNVTFAWTSSNQAVASINSNGLATGLVAGSTIIGATVGSINTGTALAVTAGGGSASNQRVYTSKFPLTQNPISEGGNWINGLQTGLDWLNIRTASGVAYGTRTNQDGDAIDPTAILTGTWGWNQTAEAVLFVGSVGAKKEVELRLNSVLSPHVCNGYELLWEITGTITIVRWNGPVGNYTILAASTDIPAIASIGGFKTGDVLKATNVSGRITAYVNGVSVLSVVDTTYQAGAPGFGLNTYGGADPTTYGLSSFTASN